MLSNDIVTPLLTWYDAHKRILPWRENRQPYRIWVSEIMLQQTRVEAVKPYYDRFMNALPDIRQLALAQEDHLLKLWEGLGYYNRVKNMQKAAQIVMREYAGEMPASYELLLSLPGIGSYTAGAIASIAFEEPVPAVDGNVLRILTRLCADTSDVLSQKTKTRMEQQLLQIMPKGRPGDFNQAMMELGATVCLPNGAPRCESCPWMDRCEARKQNLLSTIPHKAPKKPRVIEQKTVLLIRNGERTLIQKRPATGLLAGLFEFPNYEGYLERQQIEQKVAELGYQPLFVQPLEDAVHIFSHREWHMKGYMVKVADREFTPMPSADADRESYLILPSEIEESYPIPSAFRAYTKYVDVVLGNEQFLR